jgi:hypothetical protein
MSNPTAKPAAHTLEAIIDDVAIMPPDVDDEEDSSDESRRSVRPPPELSPWQIRIINQLLVHFQSIDDTMSASLGLEFASPPHRLVTRMLSPPPKAPRARMLSLPNVHEDEDMLYASIVPTPV